MKKDNLPRHRVYFSITFLIVVGMLWITSYLYSSGINEIFAGPIAGGLWGAMIVEIIEFARWVYSDKFHWDKSRYIPYICFILAFILLIFLIILFPEYFS
jgi:F0F1-type ATP synthase membrane subunit a